LHEKIIVKKKGIKYFILIDFIKCNYSS